MNCGHKQNCEIQRFDFVFPCDWQFQFMINRIRSVWIECISVRCSMNRLIVTFGCTREHRNEVANEAPFIVSFTLETPFYNANDKIVNDFELFKCHDKKRRHINRFNCHTFDSNANCITSYLREARVHITLKPPIHMKLTMKSLHGAFNVCRFNFLRLTNSLRPISRNDRLHDFQPEAGSVVGCYLLQGEKTQKSKAFACHFIPLNALYVLQFGWTRGSAVRRKCVCSAIFPHEKLETIFVHDKEKKFQ